MVRSSVLGVVSAFAYLAPGCGSEASDPVTTSGATGGGGGAAGSSSSAGGASTAAGGSLAVGGAGGAAGAAGSRGGAGSSSDAGDAEGAVREAGDSASVDGPADAPSDDAREGGAGDGGTLDIKTMTFNIRYANPADGANVWANRRDLVYRVIRAENADTAGLQEALITQLQDIDAGLPEFHRIGVGRDDGVTAGEFSAILYRASKFDVPESGTFWFSDTPDVAGSSSWGNASIRICTWGRFVDKTTGRAFYQFNVHLDNVSQPANQKSVQLLMKRASERKVQTDPFFVTGDFNTGESQPAVRYMTGAAMLAGMSNPIPLVDSFRQLDPNATGVGTFHNFMGGTSGDKIDFIFMGPGEKPVSAEIIRTMENGHYPSDHYPVSAGIDVVDWR
jgi:endonuclease/exonuclease/phosphatase family metal-dependent hydrolase